MKKYKENFHGITITVKDASDDILKALSNAEKRGLETVGDLAEGYAKDIIVKNKRVDTGRMLNSVSSAVKKNEVYVGSNVEYAPYHEFGTSKGIKAIHFLKRAASEHTDEYRQTLKDSLENA